MTITPLRLLTVFFSGIIGLLYPFIQGEQTIKICEPVKHHDARDEMLAFFKVRDALDITWLHAVNSPIKLHQGLSGETMMFEADVLMRNNKVNGTPVMAHPPAVDSNLTLADFLQQTTSSTKGIKLDFKTIMVVEPSLKMVQNMISGHEVKNPIWLNADILPGPCYDKVCVPVDHVQFLALSKKYFPKATLSISWTTGKNMTPTENHYNWSQVLAMGKLVSQISQPITFPIRAVLVKRSWEQIHWLLSLSDTFTVTIWSSVGDKLDVQDLVKLRLSVWDKRRIYYDLPPTQEKAFKEAVKSAGSDYNKNAGYSLAWIVVASKRCEDVIVGGNGVVFSGDGGHVISKKTLPKVFDSSHLFIDGMCSFIRTDGRLDEKRSITIRIHVENTIGNAWNDGKFITLVLHSNGDFQFSINGVDTKEGCVKSETSAFKFSIEECSSDGKHRNFKCEITAQESKGDKASVFLATESEPTAGHLVISTATQSGAVLVQNVEFIMVMSAVVSGGASAVDCLHSSVSAFTEYHTPHTFVVVVWALMAIKLHGA